MSGQVLRVGVLLDEETERLLGGLVATLEVAAVIDDQPGRRALEPLFLDQRQRTGGRVLVVVDQLAPGVELATQGAELHLDAVAVLGQGRRGREGPGACGTVLRFGGEW